MQKKIVALAVAGLSTAAFAQTNVTIYGVADATFDVLVDHVRSELGPRASIKDIRARTTAMWSLAHGLATLLIEGPLEVKVGAITNRRAFIRSVALQSGLPGRGR